MLPDELMGDSSLLAQMNGVCASTGGSVVALKEVPHEDVSSLRRHRPVRAGRRRRRDRRSRDLVEKPPIDEAPSDFVIIGRYVLTPDVFDEIAAGRVGRARRDPAHRRPAGPGRRARRSTASSAASTASTPARRSASSTAAIELGLRDPELRPGPRGSSSPTSLARTRLIATRSAAEAAGLVERPRRTRRRRTRSPRRRRVTRRSAPPAVGDALVAARRRRRRRASRRRSSTHRQLGAVADLERQAADRQRGRERRARQLDVDAPSRSGRWAPFISPQRPWPSVPSHRSGSSRSRNSRNWRTCHVGDSRSTYCTRSRPTCAARRPRPRSPTAA